MRRPKFIKVFVIISLFILGYILVFWISAEPQYKEIAEEESSVKDNISWHLIPTDATAHQTLWIDDRTIVFHNSDTIYLLNTKNMKTEEIYRADKKQAIKNINILNDKLYWQVIQKDGFSTQLMMRTLDDAEKDAVKVYEAEGNISIGEQVLCVSRNFEISEPKGIATKVDFFNISQHNTQDLIISNKLIGELELSETLTAEICHSDFVVLKSSLPYLKQRIVKYVWKDQVHEIVWEEKEEMNNISITGNFSFLLIATQEREAMTVQVISYDREVLYNMNDDDRGLTYVGINDFNSIISLNQTREGYDIAIHNIDKQEKTRLPTVRYEFEITEVLANKNRSALAARDGNGRLWILKSTK